MHTCLFSFFQDNLFILLLACSVINGSGGGGSGGGCGHRTVQGQLRLAASYGPDGYNWKMPTLKRQHHHQQQHLTWHGRKGVYLSKVARKTKNKKHLLFGKFIKRWCQVTGLSWDAFRLKLFGRKTVERSMTVVQAVCYDQHIRLSNWLLTTAKCKLTLKYVWATTLSTLSSGWFID